MKNTPKIEKKNMSEIKNDHDNDTIKESPKIKSKQKNYVKNNKLQYHLFFGNG